MRRLLPLANVASVHLMLQVAPVVTCSVGPPPCKHVLITTTAVQAEAAIRLTSTAAGDSAYRAMSLFVAFYSVPTYCFTIDRRHFLPAPGVDAALAQFMIKPAAERPAVRSEQEFFRFLTMCFHMRRKTLLNNLKGSFGADRVLQALEHLELPVDTRAQALGLEHFVRLHGVLAGSEIDVHGM